MNEPMFYKTLFVIITVVQAFSMGCMVITNRIDSKNRERESFIREELFKKLIKENDILGDKE